MTPTAELLARVSAALEGVTPGPWLIVKDPGSPCSNCDETQGGSSPLICRPGHDVVGIALVLDDENEDNDARFIAAARTLLPELAEEVRRLRARVELARDTAVQWVRDMASDDEAGEIEWAITAALHDSDIASLSAATDGETK